MLDDEASEPAAREAARAWLRTARQARQQAAVVIEVQVEPVPPVQHARVICTVPAILCGVLGPVVMRALQAVGTRVDVAAEGAKMVLVDSEPLKGLGSGLTT